MNLSPFVQSLLDNDIVTRLQADKLCLDYSYKDILIAEHLFSNSKIDTERELLGKLYGDSIGIAYIELNKSLFQPSALEKIPEQAALKFKCIPLYEINGVLTVAMYDPHNTQVIDTLKQLANTPISAVFAFQQEIQDFIQIQYGSKSELEELSVKVAESAGDEKNLDKNKLTKVASSQSIIDLAKGILLYALKYKASDIHIQPTSRKLEVRYRIDGVLQPLLKLEISIHQSLIARLKIIADMDVTERKLPQDGRISLELADRTHDFRIATSPTIFGEKAVIRASGQSAGNMLLPLKELGLTELNLEHMRKILRSPNGVFFVTGPTGSGKTTTLYSALAELHRPEINIVTVEDPVEIRIDGISQIQVNNEIGLDFSKVLRSVLRQDPEVILVGEIRDLQTAKIAAEAALTGHLVLVTMHTNSAIQAVTRLMEMGVEPYVVAPSVIGVVSQRLVRRICEHCKESYKPSKEMIEKIFYNTGGDFEFYRGKGCEYCNKTGYSGRIGVHEVLVIDEKMREMIGENATVLQMKNVAIENGFRPLRYDGMLKVLLGQTTVDEIERITGDVAG